MTAPGVGAVGLGATMAGGILSAFGNERSGEAQQQMYNYQAAVAKINANIDRQNADYAQHQGDVQGFQYGLKAAQRQGAIRTQQAASGVDVNSGSAAKVQESQQALTRMDEATIRDNAAKTAYDFSTRAVMDQNQAGLDVMAGQNAKIAGDINAMSSIIGTAGSVSSKWMAGRQQGMWG